LILHPYFLCLNIPTLLAKKLKRKAKREKKESKEKQRFKGVESNTVKCNAIFTYRYDSVRLSVLFRATIEWNSLEMPEKMPEILSGLVV